MPEFDLKKLDSEEGRREYYTYKLGERSTLRHHSEPYLDPRFNEELAGRYGFDQHGDQRMRFVWAGNLRGPAFRDNGDGTITEYEGMKYSYSRFSFVRGYSYLNDNAQRVTVSKVEHIPSGKMYATELGYDDLGVMKFALEQKYTAEEMIQLGDYPHPDSPQWHTWCVREGKRYRRKPSENGEYKLAHYVETQDGEYRDVTQADVDRIHQIVNQAMNETEEEFVARKMETRAKLAQLEQENEAMNFATQLDRAIVKGEKTLARGDVKIFT